MIGQNYIHYLVMAETQKDRITHIRYDDRNTNGLLLGRTDRQSEIVIQIRRTDTQTDRQTDGQMYRGNGHTDGQMILGN